MWVRSILRFPRMGVHGIAEVGDTFAYRAPRHDAPMLCVKYGTHMCHPSIPPSDMHCWGRTLTRKDAIWLLAQKLYKVDPLRPRSVGT